MADELTHSCSSRLHLGMTYKHERMHCAHKGIDDARPPPSEDTYIIASNVILSSLYWIERERERGSRLARRVL